MSSNVNTWVWLAVVLLITILRYVSRAMQMGVSRTLQIEDMVMAGTVIFYILLTVFLIEVAKHGTNEIPPDQFGDIDPSSIPDRITGSKLVIVVEQMWLATIWGCKACLLLLYSTMTSGLSQHRAVRIIGAFCAFSFVLIEVLFFAAWCRPFSAYWSVPPKNLQCSVYRDHLILVLSLNILTDVLIMAIPLPLLFKARLTLLKKVTLLGVFSLGAFVILCSILSKYYSLSEPYGEQWVDWYVREAATAVIVANIPQTWTLFRRVFNWRAFLAHSSHDRSYGGKYTSRLDSSTMHLSRFRGGDQSQLRSTIDRTESGEHIAPEQPLEIWEHRQFHVTNEPEPELRPTHSLSDGSRASLEYDPSGFPSHQSKTVVTTATP
ncbi:UbiD family decarboxylase [Aspergillus heteromorphus CBS 117.55]|uniref:UbiD family decarboxylase n=1 Tax=Aspergillus heteromorphus CBS 117.55 TaxID=1448321 RepID=A0A317WS46_9EURO|nr:UbiD family decarboxylase [Aspergillus heteromorphus CBS 117.55]PWY88142.1 UbiD family decarboxylase [Aspergillus heteromorphus CBS 117.55]